MSTTEDTTPDDRPTGKLANLSANTTYPPEAIEIAMTRLRTQPTVSIADVGVLFGVSRQWAYDNREDLGIPLIAIGRHGRIRVPSAPLRTVLGITD